MSLDLVRVKNLFSWTLKEYWSSKSPKEIYNELAANNNYDSSVNYQKRVEKLNKALLGLRTEFGHILDLACGTGALIEALPWKKSAKIIGVDISEEMLKVARERFTDHPNITFKEADFMDLDFPESSFDLITNAYATRFIPRGKELEFANLVLRLLKPSGRFIVFTDASFRLCTLFYFRLGLRPKNYNLKLNFYQDIIETFSKFFILEKVVHIRGIPFVGSNTMIVFRKNDQESKK